MATAAAPPAPDQLEESGILRGEFSQMGRMTNIEVKRLKGFCDFSHESSPKAGGGGGAASPKNRLEELTSPKEQPVNVQAFLGKVKKPRQTRSAPTLDASTYAAMAPGTIGPSVPPSPMAASPKDQSRSSQAGKLKALTMMVMAGNRAGKVVDEPSSSTAAKTRRISTQENSSNAPAAPNHSVGRGSLLLTAPPAAVDANSADTPPGRNRKLTVVIPKADDIVSTVEADEELRMSPAFLATGQDKERFCNKAIQFTKRHMAPAKFEERPDVGRYQPKHTMVMERAPAWNFGSHPVTEPRKTRELDINVRDPFSHADMGSTMSSLANTTTGFHPYGLEPMDLTIDRKPLCGQSQAHLSEMKTITKPWHMHDSHSSNRARAPDIDFDRVTGRKSVEKDNFFQAGKYKSHSSSPTKVPAFKKALARERAATGQLGHNHPVASLKPGSHGKSQPVDLSLYRGCPMTVSGVKAVNDFDNELPRPPLAKAEPVYFDEDDPEVMAAWMQHQLTFDASSADRAVIPRGDRSLNMAHTVTRGQLRGSRLLECDKGMLLAQGRAKSEGADEMEKGKEQDMYSPSRRRLDIGVKHFHHYKGREHSRVNGSHSSLRRPRSMAAPDFERSARSGFGTRAAVSRPGALKRNQIHEALATWGADSLDEEEMRPPPGFFADERAAESLVSGHSLMLSQSTEHEADFGSHASAQLQ